MRVLCGRLCGFLWLHSGFKVLLYRYRLVWAKGVSCIRWVLVWFHGLVLIWVGGFKGLGGGLYFTGLCFDLSISSHVCSSPGVWLLLF